MLFNISRKNYCNLWVKVCIGVIKLSVISIILPGCNDKDQELINTMSPKIAIPVNVVLVEAKSVPIATEVVAQTEGAKEIEIRPRVGGILLKRLYEEGTAVEAGQPMFLIDPIPYQNALAEAKAQFSEQKARIEQTRREEKRLQELLSTKSISQREYDNAVSDYEIASAALKQAEVRVRNAELNLSYTTVTAPVEGISGRRQLSEGVLVQANTSLLTTIIQLSPIWVRFSLSDNELIKFGGYLSEENITKVTLILPNGREYEKNGKLNFTARQIDPMLGTQSLRATFDNSNHRLLPGQFVRIRVITGEQKGIFLVPQTAVLTSDLGRAVYVVNKKNESVIRPVVTGEWIGKDWVITEGLSAGDRVIVDNLMKLRPGTLVLPHVIDIEKTYLSKEIDSSNKKLF
tara:strand:- start:27153 stop:28361 length:1209 start_codon:yes stop_codon:yes gene_type:complete